MARPRLLVPHRTAITRHGLSAPLREAITGGALRPGMSVLDYGCGRGGDVAALTAAGYQACGWDPVYAPGGPRVPADLVYVGYVLNVIVRPAERVQVLEQAWALTRGVLVVAVRTGSGPGRRFNDGVMTAAGTFQRYYTPAEIAALGAHVTGRQPVAVRPPGTIWIHRRACP
jgi:DNA phosphorothioation-associated putative methyltransferase